MRQSLKRLFPSLLCCLLLTLLAACGSNSLTGNSSSTQTLASGHGQSTSTQFINTGLTQSLPPTPTNCPAAGTARAAITAHLALGSHANIVYIVNEQSGNTPTFGTLKRYDTTNGQKTEIVKLPGTSISAAQLSADGQWLLFVAIVSKQARLELVRMDGKGLQTLYCASAASNGADPSSAISYIQWSSDQKLIAFDSYTDAGAALYILSIQSGTLQKDLSTVSAGMIYPIRTWLDTTRLYIAGPMIDAPSGALYILDTSKGSNQTSADLQEVFDASSVLFCWDFDSSYNGQQLFTSQCHTTPNPQGPGEDNRNGPSTISVQPATGGSAQTVLNNPTLAIVGVRSVTASTLLLQTQSESVATANNGLWKVQANGSGLTPLINFGGGASANGLLGTLNRYNQYPWSNVSRDSSLYTFEEDQSSTVTLLFGSLNGGATTTIASISDGTQLSIVGWTTM
jgi:eukaryotic-like serine/threonine-protein kinase